MAGWKRLKSGDLVFYRATTLNWLPNVVQAFTTRDGGVSAGAYRSLNLSHAVGDSAESVVENLARVSRTLGDGVPVVTAEQVHGDHVARIDWPQEAPVKAADALITNCPNILLSLRFADCVPIYLVDPVRRAVGLVHAGWRGAALDIARKTVRAMEAEFGSVPSSIQAAIGPCISGEKYEVGIDVVDRIRPLSAAMSGGVVFPSNELSEKFTVNLRMLVFNQLLDAGISAEKVAVCDECTFVRGKDFFSHRRDSPVSGTTGRMGAYIGLIGNVRPYDPDKDSQV